MLLGNDILSCFKVEIDWINNTATLEPLHNLEKRNKLYPDKQLNNIEVTG
jgi:hypothetical protein